jgi:ribosomal protein S6--L-glutamate ligase
MFRKLGIDTPITRIVSSQEKLEVVIDRITTFPVVIKTISGYGGAGVFKIDSVENLRPTLQTIWNISEDEEMLIQDFIESDGDIRIHVLGGEIIAAMKRVKPDDDFRSNYSLGGDIESVEITDKMKNMAILATKESGLSWSGVDIIIDKKNNKPYMVEINGSPGTEGIDKVLKTKSTIDIVLEFIKDKNNWDN